MATTYKIHPAIGIARVGNSPDEFFIGPERLGERPAPAGGFKDAQCRVKRQAARFRIFAHHDDGTFEEITASTADIQWTVQLANRKAAQPSQKNFNTPAADLVIDPGARTTTGPNQGQRLDTGQIHFSGQPAVTVPLGEMRTDGENHLLVLGGSGTSASPSGNPTVDLSSNPGWYDDVSDGPVSATIQLHATGATPAVVGAWVIVAPPKFAPHQDSPTTLYDRVLEAMVQAGKATAPNATSYTSDVYPILQRARDIRWVYETSAHLSWVDPVTNPTLKTTIFNRLRPAGDMPKLNDFDSALTSIQRDHMQRWKDDSNFVNDWAGIPAPEASVSPAGMDRAALDACVGGAFSPGIEAGGEGSWPILNSSHYAEAFRIDHGTVLPGAITASMALPWQADFFACGDKWWPVPRPNRVIPQGSANYENWARGVGDRDEMVQKWHTLGFVVEQGAQHVEVERCDTASITLLTPYLNFLDVPQGPMGMVREQPLAITFEVISPSTAITLEYAPAGGLTHLQLVAANTSVTVGPTPGNGVATARLWVIYRTGAAPSAIPTQTVTVREPVSGQTWDVSIDANTVARKSTALALVLDRSGSMKNDRGDGQSKHRSLQEAAEIFVNVMLEGDGVGLVRYDQDAQVIQPVLPLGSGGISDLNRNSTLDLIRGHSFDPAGSTSIGDGIFEGRHILDNASGTFDHKALTVLTDGIENSPRFIADVASQIDALTYAIGLGTPQNTSAAALQNISGNNGGFLLVTGAIGTDNRFLLQKYFLQILAGVVNAEVVLDPDGLLVPGAVQRIPFQLTEADSGVDVILLSSNVEAVDFRLQTPSGQILEPWRALNEPAMRYVLGRGVTYYRLTLPTQLTPNRFDQEGTWHALLTIGSPRMQPTPESAQGVDRSILVGLHATAAMRARAARVAGQPTERERQFALAQRAPASQLPSPAAVSGSFEGGDPRATLPYSLVVHSYSSVALRAESRQSGYEPGAKLSVEAVLTQSGLPLNAQASVFAELTRPDGTQVSIPFQADANDPGHYSAEIVTGRAGTYRLRVRARGRTRKGSPFARERSLTAAVWRGGDGDAETAAGGGTRLIEILRERDARLCELLDCLLRPGGAIEAHLEKHLGEAGLDLDHVRKCLAGHCDHGRLDG